MPEKTIGRNDICKCGSGKKYKKCCLEKEQEQKVLMHNFIAAHPQLAAQHHKLLYPGKMPLYPWMSPFYVGVGKYAPKKEDQTVAATPKS